MIVEIGSPREERDVEAVFGDRGEVTDLRPLGTKRFVTLKLPDGTSEEVPVGEHFYSKVFGQAG